jgi:uncharacterized protein
MNPLNCPLCGTGLLATERLGIEIDHCPRCRGVWLDRGELDKLMAHAGPRMGAPGYYDDDSSDAGGRYSRAAAGTGHHGHGQPPPRKKKSFFGELFDF